MQDLITVLVLFLPLVIILWVANLADRQREQDKAEATRVLSILTYLMAALLYMALIMGGLLAQLAAMALHGNLPADMARNYQAMGIDPASIAAALPRVGLGLALPSLFALILLLRPVRNLLSRLIPIDPNRTVHAIALSYSMLVLVNLLVTLGLGLGNLTSALQAGSQSGAGFNPFPSVWGQELVFLLMALIGVGWLARRRLGEALTRLGIVVPTLRQVLTGVGIGLVMLPVIFLVEFLSTRIGVGANSDVEKLSEQLLGPLMRSVPGIITLGVAAAIGEEPIFRGALMPRFGLLLQAVLFALLHSNYGISISTLIVLILGLVLGMLRQRTNTTTSMIAHAVYNMSLGIIAYLGIMQNF